LVSELLHGLNQPIETDSEFNSGDATVAMNQSIALLFNFFGKFSWESPTALKPTCWKSPPAPREDRVAGDSH
jgi:hypothetical protein